MTRIAVVTSGFPRLSETFMLHELLALEAAGMLAGVFATKPGDGSDVQPAAEQLSSRVHHLAPGLPEQQAEEIVRLLDKHGEAVDAIHGYFAHTPAEVARAAARTLAVPFGFSVHARDARKVDGDELAARVREAAVVVACNQDVCRDVRHHGAKVVLLPHGVDTERFAPTPFPDGVFTVLAVGRLVEKKGFSVLIDAVAQLDGPFALRIIGDGQLRHDLARRISDLGLDSSATLAGPTTHAELPREFARAHVAVVPSIVDATGDRDGLPNVVLEAMASGRPVVGSDAGAIASAIRDGNNGFIVPAGEVDALAKRLRELSADRELLERLGAAARNTATQTFNLDACTHVLVSLLEQCYG